MASTYHEIYRGSPLGIALCDSLDDLIRLNVISGDLGMAVLKKFDRVLADALVKKVDSTAKVKAHLRTFRHCDEVWCFWLRNASFKMDDGRETVTVPKIKVVACKHADAVEPR
ncbi:transcription initiation factor IIA gamma subunit [Mycena maculata]|uniref:Transcription initiation factor IIA subunit 2 n=1 Tax=Mycena maculata TaxID=230809 RepID=A0AAD7H805_9AGAR|nr:transcription initiation factor IIA gamma subunit [Mycena maculata]